MLSTNVTVILTPEVHISPHAATVGAGNTYSFQASVYNTSKKGVTWSIDSGLGSIDSYGLFTAPTGYQGADSTAIIRATLKTNALIYDTALVTITEYRGVQIRITELTDFVSIQAQVLSTN